MISKVKIEEIEFEKYKDFKLCYIDSIPSTYYDYTEETMKYVKSEEYLAWERKEDAERERSLAETGCYTYKTPPPYISEHLHFTNYPSPDYVKGKSEFVAYFTPMPLSEQWGDDWDDAPYEHNAGIPYDSLYKKKGSDGEWETFEILCVRFYVPYDSVIVKFPLDDTTDGSNSEWCVKDINGKKVPWIRYGFEGKKVNVFAGVSPKKFSEQVSKINSLYEKRY